MFHCTKNSVVFLLTCPTQKDLLDKHVVLPHFFSLKNLYKI